MESSDDAIVGKNSKGSSRVDTGQEEVLGCTASEMVGRSILRLSPERRDEETRILAQVRRGEAVDYETVRVRKDGRAVHISVTVFSDQRHRGKIVGASKVARDITAAQRNEEALRAERERLQLAANAAGLGIWMWRPEADEFVWEASVPYQILGHSAGGESHRCGPVSADDLAAGGSRLLDGRHDDFADEPRFELEGRLRRRTVNCAGWSSPASACRE